MVDKTTKKQLAALGTMILEAMPESKIVVQMYSDKTLNTQTEDTEFKIVLSFHKNKSNFFNIRLVQYVSYSENRANVDSAIELMKYPEHYNLTRNRVK